MKSKKWEMLSTIVRLQSLNMLPFIIMTAEEITLHSFIFLALSLLRYALLPFLPDQLPSRLSLSPLL